MIFLTLGSKWPKIGPAKPQVTVSDPASQRGGFGGGPDLPDETGERPTRDLDGLEPCSSENRNENLAS